jgi:hypothetical protein
VAVPALSLCLLEHAASATPTRVASATALVVRCDLTSVGRRPSRRGCMPAGADCQPSAGAARWVAIASQISPS